MNTGFLRLLRPAALTILAAGAGGSLGLMFQAGRHNNSRLLVSLFAVWVLSPFLAAFSAWVVSSRWSPASRTALYVVMLVFTLGSLAIYGDVAWGYSHAKTGFVFLVVPLVSWLLLATVVSAAALKKSGDITG